MFLEDRQCSRDSVQQSLDVDVDHAIPLVSASITERCNRHQPGIVDQYINAPVGVDGTLNERFDLFLRGDIGLIRDCLTTCIGQLSHQCVEFIFAACGQHYARAKRSKVACSRFTQATAGAGDNDNFSRNVIAHVENLIGGFVFRHGWLGGQHA